MDPRIDWAVREMERQLGKDVHINDLAVAVRLSPSRFTHLFHAEIGVPPVRHLRALRLERARVLLETTFLSVKEIMASVGLNDPSHFTRDFRRRYGASPREWREIARLGAQRRDDTPGRPRLIYRRAK